MINMKRTILRFRAFLLMGVIMVGAVSCNNQQPAKNETNTKKNPTSVSANLPNYRYVDLDTVLSRYNLAKDYNEEMLRLQSSMENEVRRHQTTLQNFENTVNNKLQNNGYLSEASYKQDQEKYASMQASAQKSVSQLENDFQTRAMKAQQTVNDSIQAFIKDYNASHGYDAILFKAATLYVNPALDITDEVIEGLNARYNKVKK